MELAADHDVHLVVDAFLDMVSGALIGALPERQPWRGVVAGVYVVAILAGLGALIWTVTAAL